MSVRLLEVSEADTGLVDEAAMRHLEQAREELSAYFAGRLRRFTVPLDLGRVTPFQDRVLRACAAIPYGETVSYGELARRAGAPRASRAVGQVMARNRLALLVPCHRVIGSNGGLTGFGPGVALKQRLLEMERQGGGWGE